MSAGSWTAATADRLLQEYATHVAPNWRAHVDKIDKEDGMQKTEDPKATFNPYRQMCHTHEATPSPSRRFGLADLDALLSIAHCDGYSDGYRERETDDDRFEEALLDVIAALVPAIGLPPDVDGGPRVAPPGCTLVDPDRIPAGALYTAAKALDMVALALSVLRGQCDTPSVVPSQLEAAYDIGWRAGMREQLDRLEPLLTRLRVLYELLDLLSEETALAALAAATVDSVTCELDSGDAFAPLEPRDPPPTSSTVAEREGQLREWLKPYLEAAYSAAGVLNDLDAA